MTPNQMRARAKKLEAEGGNRDLINKLLDNANDAERKAYEAGKKTGEYKEGGMTMVKKDAPMMKKVAAKAVKGHEKRMHGSKKMAHGGSVRGDGCAVKGKTKGAMR